MAATTRRAPAGVTGPKLRVNWIGCDGRGLCAELLPELVGRDDWGYPIIADAPVPPHLLEYAQRAISVCPKLALRLVPHG